MMMSGWFSVTHSADQTDDYYSHTLEYYGWNVFVGCYVLSLIAQKWLYITKKK